MELRGEENHDRALALLTGSSATFGGGLSNHGPMVCDALVRLGRPEEVLPWVARYAERLAPATDEERATTARIAAAIARDGWSAVLADRLPLLVPGVLAGAFHAVIRVAHAVDALERRPSALREAELAEALGSWVDGRLPLGAAPPLRHGRPARALLAEVPRVPAAPGDALITTVAVRAAGHPGFEAAVSGPELPHDPGEALRSLAACGRDLLLGQPRSWIVYTHLVTGPTAVARLLPWLDRATADSAVAFTWKAAAAVHAGFGDPPLPRAPTDDGAPPIEVSVERAVAGGDEHAIKLALACRDAHRQDGDPRWLAAAAPRALR